MGDTWHPHLDVPLYYEMSHVQALGLKDQPVSQLIPIIAYPQVKNKKPSSPSSIKHHPHIQIHEQEMKKTG